MNKGQCQQDLLTDSECSAGIEADFVISLGSKNVSAYMSRCRGQFVHIDEHQGMFRMNSCCEWFEHIMISKNNVNYIILVWIVCICLLFMFLIFQAL